MPPQFSGDQQRIEIPGPCESIFPDGTGEICVRCICPDGTVVELPASAEARQDRLDEIVVLDNYPNPFNPTTTIRFDLPNAAEVSVDVFDMLGRTVLSVPVQSMAAGQNQSIQVDGSNLASGLYLYRITARVEGTVQIQTGRMTLLK